MLQRRKFIQLSATYGLLLPFTRYISKGASAYSATDAVIKARSLAAFNRFEQVWQFNDFWKRGNTFDACLNFADALHKRWPEDPEVIKVQQRVGQMLEVNYTYFHTFDPGGLWADDFGWWGLMGLNARTHLIRLNNKALADKYFVLSAKSCWEQEKVHAYDKSTNAKPVPHGCSNGDANGQSAGVKNTVTNVLFFLLSVRLYRLALKEGLGDSEKYLEMAFNQWVWFDSWFKLKEFDYLKKFSYKSYKCALVQERPTAFFEGSDYQKTAHPTWEKGWTWTGDQGMLVAALNDMLAIKSNIGSWLRNKGLDQEFNVDDFGRSTRKYIDLLLNGIHVALFSKEDHIIREAPFNSNFGPAFGNDYLAGRGILMRYLGNITQGDNGDIFRENIKKTVDALWESREIKTNQFQPEFTSVENDKLYVAQYRTLLGLGDEMYKWDIATMDEMQKFGVCQSIGLDAMGAYLTLK